MKSILIICDNDRGADLICTGLDSFGYKVSCTDNIDRAEFLLGSNEYDLMCSTVKLSWDYGIPFIDGMYIAEEKYSAEAVDRLIGEIIKYFNK